jgi:hypothetical protein
VRRKGDLPYHFFSTRVAAKGETEHKGSPREAQGKAKGKEAQGKPKGSPRESQGKRSPRERQGKRSPRESQGKAKGKEAQGEICAHGEVVAAGKGVSEFLLFSLVTAGFPMRLQVPIKCANEANFPCCSATREISSSQGKMGCLQGVWVQVLNFACFPLSSLDFPCGVQVPLKHLNEPNFPCYSTTREK